MMIDTVDKIDLPKLLRTYPLLYKITKDFLGPDGSIPKDLPADIKDRLDGWLVINYSGTRTHGFGVQPQQPEPPKVQQPEPQQPLQSVSKEQAEYLKRWLPGRKGGLTTSEREQREAAAKPITPPPPPQPVVTVPPPPPAVRYLPTGEPELALDATNADLHRSSKEQVQDWIERKRQEPQQPAPPVVVPTSQRVQARRGWHGSKF